MFYILMDGEPFYHPLLTDVGFSISSGSVDLELGKAGSASIVIAPNHPAYNRLGKMKNLISIYNNNEEIFRGRLLHDERDFYNNRSLTLEGELAFFIDYYLPPHSYENISVAELFSWYVSIYNSQIVGYEDTKHLTVGRVDISEVITVQNVDYIKILDAMDSLTENYGGYFRIRIDNDIRYIDYLSGPDYYNAQAIEFGANLIDFSEYISGEDIVTVAIPLGKEIKDEEGNILGRVDIKSVHPQGKEHVNNPEAQNLYGNIWQTVIFDDIEDPVELMLKGQEWVDNHIQLTSTITLTAIDLNSISVDSDQIHLGDLIHIHSTPHGFDAYYQCTKVSIDILNPSSNRYTFGSIPASVSGSTNQNTKNISSVGGELTITNSKLDVVASNLKRVEEEIDIREITNAQIDELVSHTHNS